MDTYHEQLQRVQGRNLAQWLLRFRTKAEGESIADPHKLLDYFRDRVASIRHPETRQAPDWLLIDSRTGITEIGDLLLHTDFIDRMVLVSGFNEQNLAGIEAVIRSVQAKSEHGALHALLSLVFSPVPQGEEQLKQERLHYIRTVLGKLARQDEYGAAELMPSLLTIPYHPRIALREEILLREFPESDMAPAYEQVLEDLCGKATIMLDEQKTQMQAALQEADILPSQSKGSQPHFPVAPFVRLPAWNWPDPNLTSEQFKPALPKEAIPMLNDIALSLLLGKQEKQAILSILPQLDERQKYQLQQMFAEEKNKSAKINQQYFQELLARYTQQFTDWLDYWVEQGLVERDVVLSRLVVGGSDEYLGVWPKIGFFWYCLAERLQKMQCWEYVETAYRRALDCDSGYASIWHGLGVLLQAHLGRYDEAEQAYREAIKCDVQFASPWENLGILLQKHGRRYTEAAEAFRQTIMLRKDNKAPDYLCLAELGLIADQSDWVTEGLSGARQSVRTVKYRQILALLTLGQALMMQDQVAVQTAHQGLLDQQVAAELAIADWGSATVDWNFADQAPFIARLPEPEQALYQAWVSVLDEQAKDKIDPAAAFAAWLQATGVQHAGNGR